MKYKILIAFVIAFFVLLWGTYVGTQMLTRPLWLDEANSVLYAEQSWSTMIGLVQNDFSPPLYYVVLKLWIALFGSGKEWVLRLPSVFFGIASIFILYFFGKRWWGSWAGFFGALFLGVTFSMPLYFFEVRMYAMEIFFALVSGIAFFELFFRNKKKSLALWALFLGATIFGVYTHYMFWFFVVAENVAALWLIFLKKSKISFFSWFISQIMIVFFYIPWWGIFLKRIYETQIAHSTYWTDMVGNHGYFFIQDMLLAIFLSPFENSSLLILMVRIGLIAAGALFIKKFFLFRGFQKEIILFIFGVIPLFLLWIWGVWIVRYALIGFPFLILLVVAVFQKIPIPLVRNGAIAAFLFTSLLSSFRAIPEEAQKPTRQWPQIIAEIEKQQNKDVKSVILAPSILIMRNFSYYYHGNIPLKNLFPDRLILEKEKLLQYETQFIGTAVYEEIDRTHIEFELRNFEEIWFIKNEPHNSMEDPLHIIPGTLEKYYTQEEEFLFGADQKISSPVALIHWQRKF